MVRTHTFVLQACICFYIFSSVRLLVVSASKVRSDESNTCTGDDASNSNCGEPEDIHENETKDKSISSPWAFMQAFSKLGTSWNHIIGEYKSVVKGADGVDLKGDAYAQDMGMGLKLLQAMVEEEKKAISSKSKEDNELDWSFRTTPLGDFGKTIDDVLLAFLRWSVVDTKNSSQEDKSCQLIGGVNDYPSSESAISKQTINVSKAFRRLTSYVTWMKSVSSDLVDEPLTFKSISPSLSTFSIDIAHDSCGRLVWWVNLGKTDLNAFKLTKPRETMRMFVWIAHLLFLDEGAQTRGLVVVDDMAEIGFYDYMTMLPIQVGISVDRFLISVTPLKAKNVVLMHLPKWAEVGYGLLSWFLTAKMKSRVTIVTKGEEVETLDKVVGGSGFIPTAFGSVKGELKTDIISHQSDL
mmetsp:Transcript_28767/g.52498  ORF Transcript_28767/g.52498 Transcript_28767/m.52498 type:complete len:410 (+) Transcript_28767:77-1306(+)